MCCPKIYGVIYKITNNKNKKVYIGQTVDFERRKSEYKKRSKVKSLDKRSSYYFMEVLHKEGFENFTMEAIHTCYSKEELNEKEIYYIDKYNSRDPKYGYNSKTGGAGGIMNERTRKLVSKSHIGLKESASTKRKKSKPIIAVKDNELIYCESGKLFGDFVGVGKDIVKNGLKACGKVRGYFVYYQDLQEREKQYLKSKNKSGFKDVYEIITNNDVETIEKSYDIRYLTYDEVE